MDSPTDCPKDGVMMPTKGVNTKFRGARLRSQKVIDCRLTASVETGVFSIRDLDSGTMLTCSLEEAMEIIKRTLERAKEVKENDLERRGGNKEVQ